MIHFVKRVNAKLQTRLRWRWIMLLAGGFLLAVGGLLFHVYFPRITFFQCTGGTRSAHMSILWHLGDAVPRLVNGGDGVLLSASARKIYGIESYRSGLKCGPELQFQNGQPVLLKHWRQGMEEGLHLRWGPDGSVVEQGQFRHGNKEGQWTEWYEDGLRRSTVKYSNGIPGVVVWGDERMAASSNEIFDAWFHAPSTVETRCLRERVIYWVGPKVSSNEVARLLGVPVRVHKEPWPPPNAATRLRDAPEEVLWWEYDVDEKEALCVQFSAGGEVRSATLWLKRIIY